tara:strand:- start:14074 stop:16137 length:2064 start_codon:yes stop_codon:yes gene_type:complete
MKFFGFIENKKISLFLIFFISVSIRILYFYHFNENPFFHFIHDTSDAINFDAGAQNFASGDLLATSANDNYSPLYKYFLGFIYILAGRNLPVVWGVQFFLGTITVLLVFLITSKLFNERAALISSTLYALYGPELMYEGILLRASFITFLGVLSLYLLIQLEEKSNLLEIVITGFAISLFIQSRPNVILVFALLFFVSFYCTDRKNLKKYLSLSFIVLLLFIPLLIQAYIVHGKFVFFDASGLTAILMGNNPGYTGTDYLPDFRHSGDTALNYKQAVFILLQNLIGHPVEMISLYLRKFYYFFNSYEYASNYNFYIFQEFSFLLKTPFSNFAFFSSLGLMGFLLNVDNFKRLRLLYTYMIGMTVSVVLFYIISRFRIPVVPYFAIFAGCFLDKVCAWCVFKRYKKIILSVTTFIILLFMFNTVPDISKTNAANEYGNLGNAYLNIGNIKKAAAAYNKSLKIDPNNFYSHNNLGKVYTKQGRLSEALSEFTASIKLNPVQWETFYNLGLVYMRSGQFNEGEKALSSARNLAPQVSQIYFSLGNLYQEMELFDKSLESYKNYLSLAGEDWKGFFQIGNIFSKSGRFEKAIKEYKKSKKLNPKHTQTLINLGNAYSYKNKPGLALNEYLLALSLNMKDPLFHKNIGILYARKDFYYPVKAVYHLQKSLELDPDQNSAESIKKLIRKLKES